MDEIVTSFYTFTPAAFAEPSLQDVVPILHPHPRDPA